MTAPYYVELLSRHNEVRYRHRADALPIRIGRGYDNDFILDDPHTSANHAVIEQGGDGGLVVKDLGSGNGIIHKGKRRTELPIDGNTVFRLGHSSLRVRPADFPVAGELADSTLHNWEGWSPALAGLALMVLLTSADAWLGDAGKFEASRYLISMVAVLCLAMVWCGIWSFAGRLFGGQARLGRHLFILGCGIAALVSWGFVSGVVAYAFSLEIFTRYGSHVVIAILSAMVFFHLLLIKPNRVRLFAVISAVLALCGSVLALTINYNSNGFLADELFMHEHLPPVVRMSPDRPVAQLISDAGKLKSRVDQERTRQVSGYDDDDEWQEGESGSD